jgi:hypothetical protein
MHSRESCLCLGLPNILLSSLSNSSFYDFFTAPFIAAMPLFDESKNIQDFRQMSYAILPTFSSLHVY